MLSAPKSHSKRRGPGLFSTAAVLLVLIIQGGLFGLFQWINRQGEDFTDDVTVEALARVEEREIIAPENAPEFIQEEPPVLPEATKEPAAPIQVAALAPPVQKPEPTPEKTLQAEPPSEADMLQLLDQVKTTTSEPSSPSAEQDVTGLEMASTLLGRESAAKPRSVSAKPPVKPTETRTAVRPPKQERLPLHAARKIRVVSVEQSRFPSNDASDEMRVLNISIAMGRQGGDVFGDYVGIKVTFYDEVGDTGMAMPSRVQTATNPIRLAKRAWRPDANYLVTATYLVPKGFRTQYQKKTGARTKYFGYVIELYYKDQLQDVYAQPKSLLPAGL